MKLDLLIHSIARVTITNGAWANGCNRLSRVWASIFPARCCRSSASSSATAREFQVQRQTRRRRERWIRTIGPAFSIPRRIVPTPMRDHDEMVGQRQQLAASRCPPPATGRRKRSFVVRSAERLFRNNIRSTRLWIRSYASAT